MAGPKRVLTGFFCAHILNMSMYRPTLFRTRLQSMLRAAAATLALLAAATGCMRWDYGSPEDFDAKGRGLFVVNEGNFQYGNASLSYYAPATERVENEVFFRANGMKLGDVAQSMCVYDNKGWIVVNNSHVVFAIDLETFREAGRIENLTSPRYIHFVSREKAYVTQLWDNRIFVVNPRRFAITGYIDVPGMTMETGSTEQMVETGGYVYCNCWSYQNRILKIDPTTDEVVDQLVTGIQPKALAVDSKGRIWTVTDGGYEGSPYGYEAPKLCRINAATFTIDKEFELRPGDVAGELQTDGTGERLLWINDDVWAMDTDADQLPSRPLIESRGTKYYGLTVDPTNGDVYVADAIDYQQQGMVRRYGADGTLKDEFYAGVSPSAFCWK